MKNLLVLAILAALAYWGYGKYQSQITAQASASPAQPVEGTADGDPMAGFKCDGRTHCSQMTSCAEATYFIRHCPNTKMDGNNDGVPCEKQWCGD